MDIVYIVLGGVCMRQPGFPPVVTVEQLLNLFLFCFLFHWKHLPVCCCCGEIEPKTDDVNAQLLVIHHLAYGTHTLEDICKKKNYAQARLFEHISTLFC